MNEDKQQPTRRSSLSFWGLLEAASIVMCAATLIGFLSRLWWVFELTSHFRLHLAVALGSLTMIWLARRRWLIAAISAGAALVNLFPVLTVYLPGEALEANNGAKVRLVSLNVHTENENNGLVLKFLENTDADVILLMEVDKAWIDALQPLRTNYSHVVAEPREDNFGIALFSRLPLTNSGVLEFGEAEVPSIRATMSVGKQLCVLLGTHPLPPGSSEYARLRNEQFGKICTWVHDQNLPVVVLGDLNCTPWSPYFADLLRNGGLKNVSPKAGLYGSWPAWLPLFRIPLDHCLVSTNICIISKRMGPQVGSDHLPLEIELQLPSD